MTAIEEMLMMAPLFCRRMIGITCFAAKIQLLRLIATQRSSASSVMSSSSASPPARLTPTLLCTHSTLAPSRAKVRAVARPLPMPSPGLWPAPTTMATRSFRRILLHSRHRVLLQYLFIGGFVVDLHGGEHADDRAIEGDGEHEIGHVLVREFLLDLGESCIRHRKLAHHFACAFHDRLGKRLKLGGLALGLGYQAPYSLIGDAKLLADLHMMGEFVFRFLQPAHLKDSKFAQARVEFALEADVAADAVEGTRHVGRVDQELVQVGVALEHVAIFGRDLVGLKIGQAGHRVRSPPMK